MSTPIFSICHATRGRPEKAVKAMQLWHDKARHPEDVEYIFSIDSDDNKTRSQLTYPANRFERVWCVENKGNGSVGAWNEAANQSSGDILVQAQDDLEPPEGWDIFVESAIIARGGGKQWRKNPLIVAVSDGFRKDALMCTAIINRFRYDQQGYFLFPKFVSVFSDDDFTIQGFADERDGRCVIVPARDIVFRHAHHYYTPDSVPWDETYARQNDPKNYAEGERVFNDRNKHLINQGFKTW